MRLMVKSSQNVNDPGVKKDILAKVSRNAVCLIYSDTKEYLDTVNVFALENKISKQYLPLFSLLKFAFHLHIVFLISWCFSTLVHLN